MKKSRIMLFIVLAIACLSILLFVLIYSNEESADGEEKVETLIDDFEAVSEINVLANENVTITKKNEEWVLENVDQELDSEKLSSFFTAMKEMSGESVEVEKKNVNLDFPKVTVSFSNNNGQVQRISIGQMHEKKDQYYVEHREKQEIYLVDRNAIETIPLKPEDLLNNKILSISSKDVNEIEIDNGTEHIVVSNESPYSEKEALAHVSGWYMHEPYHGIYSISFSKMQEMILGVDALEKVEKVSAGKDYGMEHSDFTVRFSSDNETETLRIGEPAADNQYYVSIEGQEDVYTLPTELLNPYSHPSFDMIDQFVHIVAFEAVASLTIETNDTEATFTMDHITNAEEEVETTVFRNDYQLDTEAFRDNYKQLVGLTFDQKYEGEELEDAAEITINYEIEEEQENNFHQISFTSVSEDYYAIEKNENHRIDFVIEKEKVKQAVNSMLHNNAE
ncbi:DUF4340 domain-containing protein [Gracilibacillus kekensis]|nr:DUF4340 domain-containing protein [Gracilibacillus kekensis]